MRRNKLGEAYCHTAQELRSQIDMADVVEGEVYVIGIDHDASAPSGKPYYAEVIYGDETVCYAEADGREDLIRMLKSAGVEVQ